jgi:hypothetical protein
MEQRLKIAGLHTSDNDFESVPDGALLEAQNIDIQSRDVAKPRRGFGKETIDFIDVNDRPDRIFFYQDKLFAHLGTLGSANSLEYLNVTWSAVSGGSISAPSGHKIRTLEANQNCYITTSTGIKKLESFNAALIDSGVPKSLNIIASLGSGSLNWWPVNGSVEQRVAYRAVWCRYDANDNLVVGAPSGIHYVVKPSGGSAQMVTLRIYIPQGITTNHFLQIYRSAIAVGNNVLPSDELQLVYEAFPTSTDINTNKYIDISDITDPSLRGAALYTNATQEGISAANDVAPLAKDMTVFRDVTFYASTTSKHRFYLTLLSASSITLNDTITIAGLTYTAKSAENLAAREFRKFTAGSASQNITDTVLSLIACINASSGSVYAYYISAQNDLPGKILIEERGIGGSAFGVYASVLSYWSPSDLTTSPPGKLSTNDQFKNGLAWSKPNQPEHVPLVNNVRIGSEDAEILRILALKDAMIIFKEDGVWRLTGFYPSYDIDRLDSSTVLVGVETPVILNNEIYCLTDLGIARISDGVEVISLPIQEELIQLISSAPSLASKAFSVSYETEKKYYLFVPSEDSKTNPDFAYVYNAFTRTFVKHIYNATCGVVYDKRLWLGSSSRSAIMAERKNYNYLDYGDYAFDTAITAINGLELTLSSGVDQLLAGDIIYQSDSIFATILSRDILTSSVVVDKDLGFTLAAATGFYAIDTRMRWTSFNRPTPSFIKKYHTAKFFFRIPFSGKAYVGSATDLDPAETLCLIEGAASGFWGVTLWGSGVWGSEKYPKSFDSWVPVSKAIASQFYLSFNHRWGFSEWQLTGAALLGQAGSAKVGRC